jgi:hypothetical protein
MTSMTIETRKAQIDALKKQHGTFDPLEAIIAGGEDYHLYGDERATPPFVAHIGDGYSYRFGHLSYYTVELNKSLEYCVVKKRDTSCNCIIA